MTALTKMFFLFFLLLNVINWPPHCTELNWSSVPKHQPRLMSGNIVPTTSYELGGGPEPNQWDSFTKALFPNAWLCCSPAQLPDRRHKHTMALNMEIHQACEMFELWSHSFQESHQWHALGWEWGAARTFQMSDQKILFSFYIACIFLLVHKIML